MQVVLIMFRSDGERRSFSLPKDVTVIGRREDCDLRIPLGEVSRKHCRFVIDGDTLRVEDQGSSNGTFVNGERIQNNAVVRPGDTVQVGPVIFVVQIDGVPSDEEIQPAPTSDPNEDTGMSAPPKARGKASQEDEFAALAGGDPEDGSVVDFDLEEMEENDKK